MAPLPLNLLSRAPVRHNYSDNASSAFSGGAIGGTAIAVIIAIVVIVFICVVIHEHKKAARLRDQKGIPIKWGKILTKAALISCTLGVAAWCCADCFDEGDTGEVGSGGGGGGGGGTFVGQPPVMPQQMAVPTWQPTMDNTPISSAAADQVQG